MQRHTSHTLQSKCVWGTKQHWAQPVQGSLWDNTHTPLLKHTHSISYLFQHMPSFQDTLATMNSCGCAVPLNFLQVHWHIAAVNLTEWFIAHSKRQTIESIVLGKSLAHYFGTSVSHIFTLWFQHYRVNIYIYIKLYILNNNIDFIWGMSVKIAAYCLFTYKKCCFRVLK